MGDRKYLIPEQRIEGRRLGRHVNHDPRSLLYTVQPSGIAQSASWKRDVPILDQGDLGSCTGNAGTGALGTDPYYTGGITKLKLDEQFAVDLYSAATKIDSAPGQYPPTDTGSDGLSIAKVLKARGLISGYQHITSLDAAHTAIASGPFITGVNWYSGFDDPDGNGLVHLSGDVRGGHEFVVCAYDADVRVWTAANSWGTSYGAQGYFRFSDADYSRLLSEDGDATVLVPASQPAPTPTPTPTPNGAVWPGDVVDPWLAEYHIGKTRKVAAALLKYRSGIGQ